MRKIIFILLTMFNLLLSSSVLAMMSAPAGWYSEINGGKSQTVRINLPGSMARHYFAWSAVVGYKINTFVGAELGYNHYADTMIKYDNATTAKFHQTAYDLAAKIILPVGTTPFEFFGKAGVGRLKSRLFLTSPPANPLNLNQRTTLVMGLYLDAGLGYNVLPNMQVTAQWSRIKGQGNTGTPNLYTLGLTYMG